MGLEDRFTISNAELASFWEKHVMLERQLEMRKFFCWRETKKCCLRWGDICGYKGGLFEDGGCYSRC